MCGVSLRVGMGVAAGVGGSENPRPRIEGRAADGSWIGGGFLGSGRRKVLHSVHEQEMFSIERGTDSIFECEREVMCTGYWWIGLVSWTLFVG